MVRFMRISASLNMSPRDIASVWEPRNVIDLTEEHTPRVEVTYYDFHLRQWVPMSDEGLRRRNDERIEQAAGEDASMETAVNPRRLFEDQSQDWAMSNDGEESEDEDQESRSTTVETCWLNDRAFAVFKVILQREVDAGKITVAHMESMLMNVEVLAGRCAGWESGMMRPTARQRREIDDINGTIEGLGGNAFLELPNI